MPRNDSIVASAQSAGRGRRWLIRRTWRRAASSAGRGSSYQQVDDGADHSGDHDHEHPHELRARLEHGIVRYLDYIDDRPDPQSERRQSEDEENGDGGCV
jgi:hypothetical protein